MFYGGAESSHAVLVTWWYGKKVKVLGANHYRNDEIGLVVNTGRFEEDLS